MLTKSYEDAISQYYRRIPTTIIIRLSALSRDFPELVFIYKSLIQLKSENSTTPTFLSCFCFYTSRATYRHIYFLSQKTFSSAILNSQHFVLIYLGTYKNLSKEMKKWV